MIYTNPFRNSIPPSIAESDLGNENNLIRQWRQLKPGTVLKDRNGHSILIIFRGRSNTHEGPDFLNGVIFCEGRIIQGDIELHVKEKDWKSHGHLFDHRYRNVMLHVVRHPNLLFNKAVSWLYDLNQLTQKELFGLNQLSRVEKLFQRTELGQGTWVEWCGNVHFPAGAVYSLSRKDEQYEDWLKLWLELRLPYSYGRFQKQFQKILSPKTLRPFPVLQGLIEMENHFCNHLLCQFYLLK